MYFKFLDPEKSKSNSNLENHIINQSPGHELVQSNVAEPQMC